MQEPVPTYRLEKEHPTLPEREASWLPQSTNGDTKKKKKSLPGKLMARELAAFVSCSE